MPKGSTWFLCLFLEAFTVLAQTSAPNYVLQPPFTVANQSFALALKNSKFTCATAFSGQSVRLTGGTLYLTFKAVTQPGIACVHSDTLYGPSFRIQALTAAHYPVYAVQEPPCAPLCAAPVQQEFAGTLTVTNPQDSSWFIQPREVADSKPFTLQLLNYAYGNCQTTFTHDTLEITNQSLYASFVVENHPERLCVADIRPYGPSYPVSGLKPGKYAVYAVQHVACEYTVPRCLIAVRPVLVDTLTVGISTTPILPRAPAIFHRGASPVPFEIIQGFRMNGRKMMATPESR